MTIGRARPSASENALDDIDSLALSWRRSLAAENKAPITIKTYMGALERLVGFLRDRGMPTRVSSIAREHVEEWIVELLERYKPATVNNRYRGAAVFFKWCVEEGEIPESPMARMKPPAVPEQPVQMPTAADVIALLKACEGRDFASRRDTAIVRLLLDTGLRRNELISLTLGDVDFELNVVHVIGKGRRHRAAPFGRKAGQALDRYVRARRRHKHASEQALWLGRVGPLSESGFIAMLERRGQQAGIGHLHPHQFRHLFAHNWLAAGGQETDLMMITGWRSREMVGRYGRSAAAERAHEAHRRLSPGDRI